MQNYLTDVGAFSNSASAYGTFDQGGNVGEWTDSVIYGLYRDMRGGNFSPFSDLLKSSSLFFSDPKEAYSDVGFRVASVASAPTPITNVILSVEKTTSLSGQWQFDREIIVGPMTNTNEFYRLKIRTVVERP